MADNSIISKYNTNKNYKLKLCLLTSGTVVKSKHTYITQYGIKCTASSGISLSVSAALSSLNANSHIDIRSSTSPTRCTFHSVRYLPAHWHGNTNPCFAKQSYLQVHTGIPLVSCLGPSEPLTKLQLIPKFPSPSIHHWLVQHQNAVNKPKNRRRTSLIRFQVPIGLDCRNRFSPDGRSETKPAPPRIAGLACGSGADLRCVCVLCGFVNFRIIRVRERLWEGLERLRWLTHLHAFGLRVSRYV